MTPSEIRAARVKIGLTQGQLAAVMGVHINAVCRWENGVRNISNSHAAFLRMILAQEARNT